MGTNTDGQICYGILLDEDCDPLPWDAEEYDSDIDGWWLDEMHFENSMEIYDTCGRMEGVTREDISKYFEERRSFLEEHPLPIEVVNVCSLDCPMWVLAIPGSTITASRGYPVEIATSHFNLEHREWDKSLLAFCKTFKIEFEDKPKWYLSSYWG